MNTNSLAGPSLSRLQSASTSPEDVPIVKHYRNPQNQLVKVSGKFAGTDRFAWRDAQGITWSAPKAFLHTTEDAARNGAVLFDNAIWPESLPDTRSLAYYNPGSNRPLVQVEGAYAGDNFIATINGVLRSIPKPHVGASIELAAKLPPYSPAGLASSGSTATRVQLRIRPDLGSSAFGRQKRAGSFSPDTPSVNVPPTVAAGELSPETLAYFSGYVAQHFAEALTRLMECDKEKPDATYLEWCLPEKHRFMAALFECAHTACQEYEVPVTPDNTDTLLRHAFLAIAPPRQSHPRKKGERQGS